MFRFSRVSIEGLVVIDYDVFLDSRGGFSETYRQSEFLAQGIPNLVQENCSISKRGVLRGMHYQMPPNDQGKLVRCLNGGVFDVAVDLRRNSRTFGKHFSITLTNECNQMIWIPSGFAHGFCALDDNTVLQYKTSNYYSPAHERSVLWNDAELCIDWPVKSPVVSAKDQVAPGFRQCEVI